MTIALLSRQISSPFIVRTMGVPTNAALATLRVSKADFAKDPLLQWVCHLASPLQLTVQQQTSGKGVLELDAQNTTIRMRNSILRTLCGMGLHKALDQAPYYLLGGGATAGPLARGQLVQWMSLADSLRSGSDDDWDAVLKQLDQTLTQQSFLIGSAQPSLADFDVALVMANSSKELTPAVKRWRETVLWTFTATAPASIQVPTTVDPTVPEAPTFYDGTEENWLDLLRPPASKATAGAAGAKKGDAGKPQGGKNDNKKQEKKEKGEKGGAAPAKGGKGGAAPAPAKGGNQAPDSYDISALDIRVGKIVKAWHHEEAEKLFCEEIDLGTETRQIASGLRPFYKTEDLQDRHVLVLCNLKKRNLVGFPSHGMVLCASNADHTAVEFVVPPEGSKVGERVVFEGFAGEPEPENKVAKKKIFEKLAPDLKTDGNGNVVWKTTVAKTSAGVVKALNGMPDASVS